MLIQEVKYGISNSTIARVPKAWIVSVHKFLVVSARDVDPVC